MSNSENFPYIELSTIIEKWNHPQLNLILRSSSKEKKWFQYKSLRDLFPDTFNKDKTPNSTYSDSHHDFSNIMLSRLLHGNVRKRSDIHGLSNVTFLNNLQEHLLSSELITYLPDVEDAKNVTSKDSMINNIKNLMQSTPKTIDKNHAIFTEIPLTKENTFNPKFLQSIKTLTECNSLNSLSYAIFLLILLSIYQERINEFCKFYSDENIKKVISDNLYKDFLSYKDIYKNKAYVPFTDPKYMHKYYVYVYRSTYDDLYSEATLEMEELDDESSFARLIFDHETQIPNSGSRTFKKKYTGTPIFSRLEDMVHIVFTNPFGRIAILCFKYTHFNHSDMFYRTGFILSTRYQVPTVRRIIISSKKFNTQDCEYAKGILKMTNDDIIFTESALNSFLSQYADNSWIKEFESSFLPYIKSHEIKYYHLSADELAAYPLANLNDEERIEIIEALKALSIFPNYLDDSVPDKLHRIIFESDEKEYSK